ncbi:MAG: hypothetical protein HXX18_08240 [Bacteroidetes bacterium]|nr:hypothetical protein [Bacteroidota bacterium]
MEIYSLEEFKVELEKLVSNKSYKTLQQEIIDYFFNKSTSELCSGSRLNNSDDTPYIKKRLGGRGGFRCYFLLIIKDDSLYLMYVHPKTGSMGIDNITDESKAYLYKKVLKCIKSKDLYKLELTESGKEITFYKIS